MLREWKALSDWLAAKFEEGDEVTCRDTGAMPDRSRLEELILEQQEELLELLLVCRSCLPATEAARLGVRLEFLEGLIRLDTDRALQIMREQQQRVSEGQT